MAKPRRVDTRRERHRDAAKRSARSTAMHSHVVCAEHTPWRTGRAASSWLPEFNARDRTRFLAGSRFPLELVRSVARSTACVHAVRHHAALHGSTVAWVSEATGVLRTLVRAHTHASAARARRCTCRHMHACIGWERAVCCRHTQLLQPYLVYRKGTAHCPSDAST